MTTEEAKRRAELYSALAEGKTIQVQNPNGKWEDLKIEGLDHLYNCNNYRIKPEPKYRLFKTKEECWNEMLKHQPFGWLRDEDGDYILPATVGNKSDFIFRFKVYKFTDGTPFGIKEE